MNPPMILCSVLALVLTGCKAEDESREASRKLSEGEKLTQQGQYDAAISQLTEAINTHPDNALFYLRRGQAYQGKQDYANAIADFTRTAESPRENRHVPHGHQLLAWLYATCPQAEFRDGKKAVTHAVKACGVSNYEDFQRLSTLAAAYAEAGNFPESIQWAEKGLEFTGGVNPDAVDGARERLKLYKAGKPYREQ